MDRWASRLKGRSGSMNRWMGGWVNVRRNQKKRQVYYKLVRTNWIKHMSSKPT
jgi:hypothetical protein